MSVHHQGTPPVYVAESQYNQLFAYTAASAVGGAALLREELERAVVVADGDVSGAFVRLGSTVRYRDLISGRVRTVQIVPPPLGDIEQGRLSVTTPTGAALVGLARGASFRWAGDDGKPHGVEVLKVARS